MTSRKRFGLDEKVITSVGTVLQRYPEIENATIYGSRAIGNFREGSDIDLTFSGSQLSSDVLGRIEDDIDDLMLPYKFDLSIFKHIDNTNLVDHIRRFGKRFWP